MDAQKILELAKIALLNLERNHKMKAIDNINAIMQEIEKVKDKNGNVVCDWCGKTGNLSAKMYHAECYESVLNGAGMI